jgi:hypothetical protein
MVSAASKQVAFKEPATAVKSHDVKSKSKKAAAPAAAKKTVAAPKRAGIVVAKAAEGSDDGDDEDAASGSDADGEIFEEAQPHDRKSMRPYRALYLRHLPPQFQEPELRKFLRQFGATVVGCFVVRNKKSNSSRGSAYIRFSFVEEEIYDAIMEECHGMLLGGSTVTAKWVTLHKPMPMRKNVNKKLRLDWAHRIKGVKMVRADSSARNYVTALLAATKSERAANKFCSAAGIAYQFSGFADQLARVTPEAMETHKESCSLKNAAKKEGAQAKKDSTKAKMDKREANIAAKKAKKSA